MVDENKNYNHKKVEQSNHFLPYVSIHFRRNKLTHYCASNIDEMLQSVPESTLNHKISSSSKVQYNGKGGDQKKKKTIHLFCIWILYTTNRVMKKKRIVYLVICSAGGDSGDSAAENPIQFLEITGNQRRKQTATAGS